MRFARRRGILDPITLRHAGCSLALRMRPPAVASVMCIGCVNASGQRSLDTSSSTRLRTQYSVQPDQVGFRAGPEGPLLVRVVSQYLKPIAHFRIALTCHHYLAKKDWSLCTPTYFQHTRRIIALTLSSYRYTDIHYYFAPPTVRPVLHRFDKASYLYVYHNSTRDTNRIEIANNPGTQDQDAFHGYLDTCRVINSHRFPSLITLIVDALDSTSPQHDHDPDEWRLVSADPRDSGKRKYRLHTLDIYFWAQEDAKQVVDTLKGLLEPSQLDIVELEEEPSQEEEEEEEEEEPDQTREQQQDDPSSLVQNLENVAVSDPAYRNGQTRNSQNQPQHQGLTSPPPPPPQNQNLAEPRRQLVSESPVSALSDSDRRHGGSPASPQQKFAPMAYNPAAPPAPEQHAHREDTPPPPDDEPGIGAHDNFQRSQSQPWTGVPQPGQPGQQGQYGSSRPPPSTSLSFAGPPTASSAASYDPHRHSEAAEHYVPGQSYNPTPVETPGTSFYSTINSGAPHKPLQHIQPQYPDYFPQQTPPPGGYSNYNYSGQPQQQQQPQHHSGENPYNIHNQVYRPTESEAGHGGHQKRPSKSGSGRENKTDSLSNKAEGKFNKFMKRVEKKIG